MLIELLPNEVAYRVLLASCHVPPSARHHSVAICRQTAIPHWKLVYRNLTKGAGRSSKVISNNLGTKLAFVAFQRWFPIENRTNIRETMVILVLSGTVVFLQT